MTSRTLSDIIATQTNLVQEAAEALPFEFSQCTYSLGYIRQAVYLCHTCGETRGVCSACSVSCHTNHEQLELFPKRHFRCDCPTRGFSRQAHHHCTLHKSSEDANEKNLYGQNFKGFFCRCGRTYDATTERETMIQCLACEDWFHESCLNLRERPSREPTPQPPPSTTTTENNGNIDNGNDDDTLSEASSSGLPPPLITASKYESLVCSSCVLKIDTLKKYAGTPGILMVIRDSTKDPWKVIGETNPQTTGSAEAERSGDIVNVQDVESGSVAVGQKRPRAGSLGDEPQTKKVRDEGGENSTISTHSSNGPCLAPPINQIAQEILSTIESHSSSPNSSSSIPMESLGSGDLFLTEGFRERWCRCNACLPSLQSHPYLLEEEETYEPPEDPDSGLSLEELGLRALQRLPRDKAIDGIRAFNEFKDELMNHLRPFAQEDKEVTAEDIKAFFDAKLAAKEQR
ncbi:E3 ubiquitin-protein ligase UBR7 [Abortiporus biennis]